MKQPLVTIICISFNHAAFIKDALESVWALDYPNLELIVVDDASSDNSQEVIKELTKGKDVRLMLHEENVGHCKSFNAALKEARGEFVIDLSADDMLMNGGVCEGVECLLRKGEDYGVFFADAFFVSENGEEAGKHETASFFKSGVVPQGDIYAIILGKYFMSPPTLIFRKSLLDQIGGYDETLSYEDFDFWVRSSRISKYCYSPAKTVIKRLHGNSVSASQYMPNSRLLGSTYEVCKKAFKLNKNKKEDGALLKRLAYEGKMALTSGNYLVGFKMLFLFVRVLLKIRP